MGDPIRLRPSHKEFNTAPGSYPGPTVPAGVYPNIRGVYDRSTGNWHSAAEAAAPAPAPLGTRDSKLGEAEEDSDIDRLFNEETTMAKMTKRCTVWTAPTYWEMMKFTS